MAGAKRVAVLIDRKETLRRVPLSYTKIWQMMQAGEFPRSRLLGGKAMWLESEIEAWITHVPVRPLKGEEGAGIAHEPYRAKAAVR